MVEGISKITYKGKEIVYGDYSKTGGSKEKTLQMIKAWKDESVKHPPKSILLLGNMANLQFDKEILNAIKDATDTAAPYVKKSALIGMKPLHKAAYNFMIALTADKYTKIFNTEEEAKEWLVKD